MLGASSQQLRLRLDNSRGHHPRGSAAAAALAAASKVVSRLPLQSVGRNHTYVATAAAADGSISLTTQQLDSIVPYINNRAPRLKGRQLPQNPAEWLWQQAAQTALRGELLLAAYVDRHRAAPYIMAVLAGALTGLGLDAATLLQHGLPPYMPDLLLRVFGAWDTSLWAAALTAAAAPVTAWAVRAWWRANNSLLGSTAETALQQLWTQQQQQQQQAGHEGSEAGQQALNKQQADSSSSSSHWVAASVTVLRGLCIASATNSFIAALYSRGASTASLAFSTGTGVVALAAAAASLVLLHQRGSNASSSSSSSSSLQDSQVLAAVLASEVAWVAATVSLGPLVSAAAAVVLGGSLFVLHNAAVAPALLQYRAAAGDTVELHVGLKLAGTRPLFDSTQSEEPVRVQVGPVPAEVLQQWEAAAAVDVDALLQQEPSDQGTEAGGSGSAGAGAAGDSTDAPLITASLQEVQQDLQAWMTRPMARWEALKPFIAHAAEGLFLGERASVPLYNPKVVGYWNPSFTWWQPTAEVQQKFQGAMPGAGDVFWYPVADGAAVLTRVNAVGKDYVELDANYGVTDTQLELQVQLVRLNKPAQE